MVKVKRAPKTSKPNKYVLRLYVAGLSPRSQKAIKNIRKICDEHLPGQCQLTINDIYQNPILAKNGQILAAPTLIKELPLPLRRFVGDMSDTNKLLVGLDLRFLDKPGIDPVAR
ncbi:MAG: thiol-disulfide isomerase [Omnitrophica WOR_2 bacterium GWF2_38_59]|nr:MAG: thiol-disulfide isomerase [Omnitrophica WOR_2 bacterium GWF2_38_59]OGX50543.1 MAG: thiol-disulfide isomerase [Omnitrophica WOR_2 bacterium RIFOXYA2_FULL_38_17]OGX51835.1 MAG: thiol-disulfide isomerase [Omnitrophica WOR_2 bacterium RIFOXYA12_FULL_38_10]OGX55206.1 MAG: thiol-disulfide isomerase [Omnitrophica WOR_2 bacterium RIFOXYC2_FULL_38_12]OGX58986.1 MAG: thiol-disulfide isomerase [Omnitrophica WOR_2 bacterium RIFOXYB2_FULL_38_16]